MNLEKSLCEAIEAEFDRKPFNLPSGSDALVEAFAQLSTQRQISSHGPNPISFGDILAWSQLMKMPVEPHQVRIILAMDKVWMKRVYNRPTPPEGAQMVPARSSHKMTPALFDLAIG
jgi:hypothetical protein